MVTRIDHYSYELTPCPAGQGGGWLLRLLADGQELGRRVFPPVAGIEDARHAAEAAHDEALSAVTAWLASIESRPAADRPRPADESGMYLLLPDDWLLVPPRPPGKPEPVIIDWPDEPKRPKPEPLSPEAAEAVESFWRRLAEQNMEGGRDA